VQGRQADPERAVRSEDDRSLTARAQAVRLSLASLLAAVCVGAAELALLPAYARASLDTGTGSKFLFFAGGMSLLVMVPAIALLWMAARGNDRLVRRGRAGPLWIAAAGAASSLPYTLWLGRYTFSGPLVRDLTFQPALVTGAALLAASAFGAYGALFSYRPRGPRAQLTTAALVAAAACCLLLNNRVLPGEYPPLHTFLSIWTALLLLAAGERALSSAHPLQGSRLLSVALVVLASSWAGVALGSLPGAQDVGWIVAAETTTPRYLVAELSTDTVSPDSDVVSRLRRLATPEVDSPASLEKRASRAAAPPPHIVLFYIDNVQADRVGALGYHENPTTPNIDALARSGATFTRAYSPIPHTRAFMTTLLTGRFSHLPGPQVHGSYIEQSMTRLLRTRGYHILVQGWFELPKEQAFSPEIFAIDTFIRPPTPEADLRASTWPTVPMSVHMATISRHLDEARAQHKPAFLWLHLIHPHYKRTGTLFGGDPDFPFGTSLDALYDSAIASADAWLPKLRALIEQKLPDAENTYFFVASDHGSGMSRFKREVGRTVYQDHVHVPLVIAGPGIQPRRIDYAVDAALDVSATVLDLAGVTPPPVYEGITLIPLLDGDFQPPPSRPIAVSTIWRDRYGAVYGDWKFVRIGTNSLFDLRTDPLEQRSVAADHPDLTRTLHAFAMVTLAERMDSVERARPARASNSPTDDSSSAVAP
jgi:hypothetical protein